MERATVKTYIDQCNALDLSGAADCIEGLAADVDRLRRQIAIYQRTAKENGGAAVDAMVAQDQIAELRVEIERIQFKLQRAEMESVCAKREAAASQARELQLRDSIIRFRNEKALERASSIRATEGYAAMEHAALNAPRYTSALEALIAKAGEVMRSQALLEFWCPFGAEVIGTDQVREKIRALPGVTLEDLQK